MSIELRPITVDEYEEWMGAMRRGFGGDPGINLTLHHPVTGAAPWTEFDRSVVAIDGSEMVGTSHSYKLTIAVPGGDRLPLGGISHVCVQPTHTRRGILTSMMRMQLRDFHEWGEPLSALNASETIIYGRYGYSTACFREDWEIDRQYTAFTDSAEPRGHTEFIPSEKVGELFPEVFDRAMAGRPGVVTRTRAEWGLYVADPPQSRRGASKYFNVAYYRDGRIDGYAIYRVQGETLTVKRAYLGYGRGVLGTVGASASAWTYGRKRSRRRGRWTIRCRGCWRTPAGFGGRSRTTSGCGWWTRGRPWKGGRTGPKAVWCLSLPIVSARGTRDD